MKSRILTAILSVFLFSQISFAQLCAALKDIAAGETHTLALADDNSLWSCGSGPLGLGDGVGQVLSLQRVHGPNNIGFLNNIIAFDAGWTHSLAVDSNHFCLACGSDSVGQLGNGPGQQDSSVPIKVHGLNNDPNGLRNIVKVSAGRSGKHSLAVDSNGFVLSWGNNGSGQCATEDTNSTNQFPHLVVDSNSQTQGRHLGDEAFIIGVDAGEYHSLALDVNGFVYDWGYGVGSIPRKVPGPNGVGFLSNIIDISTAYFSLAADSNGNVWYWTTGGTPTKVAGLEHIVKVAAGSSKCAALDVNSQVWEWTTGGQPAKVPDGQMQTQSGYLEDIAALDSGWNDFRVAVDKYGRGWSWGSAASSYGGIGSGVDATEPVEMRCAQISSSVYLTKTYEIQGSEPNCTRPFIGQGIEDNYLVFEISYGNPITNPNDPNYFGTLYDVNIIDHLPYEVDLYEADNNGVYDGNNRTVTWHLGNLEPGEEGSVSLTVKVNNYARPCGQIINVCEMAADDYYSFTDVNVPVCQWGGEIIYVDKDANGYNNGTDWQNAYKDLQDALTQARNTCSQTTAIWVAAGTYKPVQDANEENYQNKSFELVDGVGLIGHFAGTENSPDERIFSDANNETILEGQIGQNYYNAVYRVVSAANINSAMVDGFTIKGGYSYGGIYLDNSDVSIVNCKFKNNNSSGVYVYNYSYPDIHNCLFMDNSSYAVYATISEPDISYCTFDGNDMTYYGLYLSSYSVSNISNCDFINHNSSAIQGSSATIDVEGCNLSQNGYGVEVSDTTINIEGCELSQNDYDGIEGSDLNLTIRQTVLERNSQHGIRLYSGSDLVLQNSVIRKSGYQGIYLSYNSGTEIINNWIHNNGTAHNPSYGAGIYFENQVGIPKVWNNTIYDNNTYGIECSQNGADPNILNCIIAGNDTNDLYRPAGSFNKVNYCLLQNTHSGTGNLTGDPGFKNPSNPNDLHISADSQCKDAGDPNGNYEGQTDIDGEARVRYGRIDIGADEYYWSSADYNEDGIVNFNDLRLFAKSWRLVDANISLDDDNDVDFSDLSLFCADWLWQKTADEGWMMCMSGGGDGFETMGLAENESAISFDVSKKVSVGYDALMLSTAAESLAKRPQRLMAKSQKFYDITPQTTISARQRELESRKAADKVSIKEILQWLDELWLTDKEVRDSTSEKEWQEFIESVKSSE